MGSFRKLRVWQAAHQLTLEVYRATATFPRRETYALTTQMRRAASSIPANIAQISPRGVGGTATLSSAASFASPLGSATELEYHLLLASTLSYLEPHVQASLEK
jgi:four helix bundle protein